VVFLRAVRETSRAHYTSEQVEAWAADYGDLDSWAAARAAAHTQLAIVDNHVAGFADLDDNGYIHMMFVDPDFSRRGVASALLASVVALARERGLPALTTFASLTSRPVFERHGFEPSKAIVPKLRRQSGPARMPTAGTAPTALAQVCQEPEMSSPASRARWRAASAAVASPLFS
jgi:putative acetyltransferase